MPLKLSRAAEWLRDGGGWPRDVKPSDIDERSVIELRDSLQAALRPASANVVVMGLMTLMLHYPRPDFSQGQAKSICLDMAHDFAEIPPDIFAEAIQDWRRTEKWFPRPAELLAKAKVLLASRLEALRDVQRVLAALDRHGIPAKVDNFTQADASEAERNLSDYITGLRARAETDVPDRGPSDYANRVRSWNRQGWVPNPNAPKLDEPEGNGI